LRELAASARNESGGLAEQEPGLVARGGGEENFGAEGVVAVVEADAAHQRRFRGAFGEDRPDFVVARENVGSDLSLEWFQGPVVAVVEDEQTRVLAEVLNCEGL
jgi:hypothetical protein